MFKIHEKKYIKIVVIIAIVLAFIVLIKNSSIFRAEQTIDYALNSKENSTEITGEITKGSMINQEVDHIYGDIRSIELKFANFSNRNNKGNINIKVISGNKILADNNYDISKINDGEFIKVPFNKSLNLNDENINIEISSPDCKEGSAVTLWMSSIDDPINDRSSLIVNGEKTGKILDMKINYLSPKVNNLFWEICILILWIMIPIGIFEGIHKKYITNENLRKTAKKYYVYIILLSLAFVLFCLRDLSFLTSPVIYAEDGKYISNIFENGFIHSMFQTRSGNSGDFQNTGSYILLFLALNITKVFHGYNLTYLPTYIGILSNLFLAIVAVISYIAFRPVDKFLSICAYFVVILIPVGTDGPEIFGRVLNTVFIWPVFAAMLLIILYRQNYNKYFINAIISLTCLLACLSFPVTYGIVGMYIGFTFLQMIIKKENKLQWLQRNIVFFITMLVGIYLLPSLLNAKGITSTMVMKKDSIVEFVIARHILYPFIYFAYRLLNNGFTIILFIIYVGIVLYALYLNSRQKNIINSYSIFLVFAIINWGASVGMRIKMTSLFDKYQTSFPDRYFYGCNIFFSVIFIYAIKIIFDELNIKKKFRYTFQVLIVVIMLVNPHLFEMAKRDTIFLNGYNNGTFNECVANSIKEQTKTNANDLVKIESYPKGWEIYIPYIYARETANSVNK
jgi:hypothetical protein